MVEEYHKRFKLLIVSELESRQRLRLLKELEHLETISCFGSPQICSHLSFPFFPQDHLRVEHFV